MTENQKILIYENTHTLSNSLVKIFIELAQNSISARGRFTVALSGGRSPLEFYSKLSTMEDFDIWLRTLIFMVDERFVPLDDRESNYKLIKENLFDYANIPKENIFPIKTDVNKVEVAAENYKNTLTEHLDCKKNNLPSFDFILLGIGEDGHTASLFADDDEMNLPGRMTRPVSLNCLKNERISLTLPVINNAKNVFFLVQGAKKSEIVKKIIEKKFDCPAQHVKPTDGKLCFLLDKHAASQLTYKENYTIENEAILINR